MPGDQALACSLGACPTPERCGAAGTCARLIGVDLAGGTTDRSYPPSKGARALLVAAQHLGEREAGGRNQGPIVEWSLRWIFEARRELPLYERLYGAGKAAWCAGFAGRCFAESGLHVAPYWSADCDSLLLRLIGRARRGEWLVQRWPCAVEPGDVVFFGEGLTLGAASGLPPVAGLTDLHHVELAERWEAPILYSLGGNTGPRGVSDRVARMERADPQVYAVARAL